jgi:UDP-N-acetylglucosamine 3-dehydrogenase
VGSLGLPAKAAKDSRHAERELAAMRVGLLGTGFAIAHATIYTARPDVEDVVVFGRTPTKLAKFAEQFSFAITTDIDDIYGDPEVDLIDVCLPTAVHAEHVVRALQAGKDVLCELPLTSTMADARRIVETQQATGRQVFVDMFSRFDPGVEFLQGAVSDGRYGALKTLRWATCTALLWEGYGLGLDSIAIDMMHSSLDTIVAALGRPQSITALGTSRDGGGSAAEVLLVYPGAIAHCSASSLMPTPYGVRGNWRAVFTGGVLESTWTAGYEGRARTELTEYTDQGSGSVELPDVEPHAAVIDHVIACREGRATNRLAPASVLDALELTLDVHHALTAGQPSQS